MQTHKLNDTHPRPPRAAGNTQMQSLLIIVGVGVVAVGSLHAFGNASKQALTARTHASGARSADVAVAPSVGSRSEAMLGFGTLSKGLDRVRRGWRNLRGLDAEGAYVADLPSEVTLSRAVQRANNDAQRPEWRAAAQLSQADQERMERLMRGSARRVAGSGSSDGVTATRYPGWAQLQDASLYREYRKMVDPMFDELFPASRYNPRFIQDMNRSVLAQRLFRAFGEDEARLDLLRTQRIRGIAPIVTPERVAGIRVKLDDTALDFIADRGGNFSLHMGRADIDTRPDAMMNLAQIRFRTSARSWGEESAAHFALSANQPRLSADQLATVPPNSALLGPGRPVIELDLARLSGVDLR